MAEHLNAASEFKWSFKIWTLFSWRIWCHSSTRHTLKASEYQTSLVFGLPELRTLQLKFVNLQSNEKIMFVIIFPQKNFFVTLSSTNFTKLEKQKNCAVIARNTRTPYSQLLIFLLILQVIFWAEKNLVIWSSRGGRVG